MRMKGQAVASCPREGVGDAAPLHIKPPAARNENLAPEQLQCLDLEHLRELQAKVEQDRLLLQQL